MTPQDIIRDVKENASEWLEMSEHPAELPAVIFANRIVKLNDYIEYLERRVKYDSTAKARIN